MSLKFIKAAAKLHNSFENLFVGGAENRLMMHSEASAAIFRVACLCTDLSNLVAHHIDCGWSVFIVANAKNLKDDFVTEYDRAMNQWRKDVTMERRSIYKTEFPRVSLYHQKSEYQAAIKEERNLMDSIREYSLVVKHTANGIREEYCRKIALQTAQLTSIIVGMADKSTSSSIIHWLSGPILDTEKKLTIGLASKNQKVNILNKLQSERKFTSMGTMLLSNENLYVISYTGCVEIFHGFIFLDVPIHMAANTQKNVKISYVETIPGYRKKSLAKELIQWVKFTSRENGFTSLYPSSLQPNESFWVKCGFKLQQDSAFRPKTAICGVDPMNIVNIIN